jgi:cell division protein FtsI (penicillin-binding protein 3)
LKKRIIILFCAVVALWSLLLLRAGYLQFMPNEKIDALQKKQFNSNINLQSRRGAIVDRNGKELALSTAVYSIYADPKEIASKKAVARSLALS